jgi:hypothetical protein
MRAYATCAARAGIGLLALAPSAAAADVVSAETGVHADTLHKFLWEYQQGPQAAALAAGRPVPGPAAGVRAAAG